MEFNPGKCTAIRVMPNKTKLARETSYAIHNKMLETSDTSRYLGVSITDNLTWSRHTAITAGKANRVLVSCDEISMTAQPKSSQFPTPPWYGPL